ncbi:hypothetical protein [Paraburkholderia lacunae]|nr:hypothetical protein [Paraburkholderia lacunae]
MRNQSAVQFAAAGAAQHLCVRCKADVTPAPPTALALAEHR